MNKIKTEPQRSYLELLKKIRGFSYQSTCQKTFAQLMAQLAVNQIAVGLKRTDYQKHYQISLIYDSKDSSTVEKALKNQLNTSDTLLIQATIDWLSRVLKKNIRLNINNLPPFNNIVELSKKPTITLDIQNKENEHFFIDQPEDTPGDGYCFFHAISRQLEKKDPTFFQLFLNDLQENHNKSLLFLTDEEIRNRVRVALEAKDDLLEDYKTKETLEHHDETPILSPQSENIMNNTATLENQEKEIVDTENNNSKTTSQTDKEGLDLVNDSSKLLSQSEVDRNNTPTLESKKEEIVDTENKIAPFHTSYNVTIQLMNLYHNIQKANMAKALAQTYIRDNVNLSFGLNLVRSNSTYQLDIPLSTLLQSMFQASNNVQNAIVHHNNNVTIHEIKEQEVVKSMPKLSNAHGVTIEDIGAEEENQDNFLLSKTKISPKKESVIAAIQHHNTASIHEEEIEQENISSHSINLLKQEVNMTKDNTVPNNDIEPQESLNTQEIKHAQTIQNLSYGRDLIMEEIDHRIEEHLEIPLSPKKAKINLKQEVNMTKENNMNLSTQFIDDLLSNTPIKQEDAMINIKSNTTTQNNSQENQEDLMQDRVNLLEKDIKETINHLDSQAIDDFSSTSSIDQNDFRDEGYGSDEFVYSPKIGIQKVQEILETMDQKIKKEINPHHQLMTQKSVVDLLDHLPNSMEKLDSFLNQVEKRELSYLYQLAFQGGSFNEYSQYNKDNINRHQITKAQHRQRLSSHIHVLDSTISAAYKNISQIKDRLNALNDECNIDERIDFSAVQTAYDKAHKELNHIVDPKIIHEIQAKTENTINHIYHKTKPAIEKFIEECKNLQWKLSPILDKYENKQQVYIASQDVAKKQISTEAQALNDFIKDHHLSDHDLQQLVFHDGDLLKKMDSLKTNLCQEYADRYDAKLVHFRQMNSVNPQFLNNFAHLLAQTVKKSFSSIARETWKAETAPFFAIRKLYQSKDSTPSQEVNKAYLVFSHMMRALSYVIPAAIAVFGTICVAAVASLVIPVYLAGKALGHLKNKLSHEQREDKTPLLQHDNFPTLSVTR